MVSAGLHAFFSLIMIIPTAFFEHKNHNSKTLSFIREHTYSWVFIFMSFGAAIFTFVAAKLRRRGMLIAVTIIMFWIIGYAYQMCIYLTSYLQHGMPMQVVDFNLIQFPTDVKWFQAKKVGHRISLVTMLLSWLGDDWEGCSLTHLSVRPTSFYIGSNYRIYNRLSPH